MSVDSANTAADGILGRMVNVLTETGNMPYKSALYSTIGERKIMQGSDGVPPDVISQDGVERYRAYTDVKAGFDKLLKQDSASLFSQTFSESLQNSLEKTELIGELVKDVKPTSKYKVNPQSAFSRQFDVVAKMIKLDTTALQNERAAYVVGAGNFDTHNSPDLSEQFEDINGGLKQFVNEMKAQGLWENVTVMCISDFGRTITSNSQGTDHGWGGNYWMMGGDVEGGKILGKYPPRLKEAYSDEVFKSRVMYGEFEQIVMLFLETRGHCCAFAGAV